VSSIKRKPNPKPEKTRKRPWQPFTVQSGTLFETNSLACGKLPQRSACRQVGIRQS